MLEDIIKTMLNYGYLPFEISSELCSRFNFDEDQLDLIISKMVKENANVTHSIFHSIES